MWENTKVNGARRVREWVLVSGFLEGLGWGDGEVVRREDAGEGGEVVRFLGTVCDEIICLWLLVVSAGDVRRSLAIFDRFSAVDYRQPFVEVCVETVASFI